MLALTVLTKRRSILITIAFALIIISSTAIAATINSQISLNFQVTTRLAPMYNLWFHRYLSPTGTSDCKWIGARGLIVYAGTQQDVACFHGSNPKIIVVTYLDRGVYANDPLYQALSTTESAWLHWQNGARAYWTYSSQNLYLPNPNSTDVRNWEDSHWIPAWRSQGVDGFFLDDGYLPCQINGLTKICTPNGMPLSEFNSGDYTTWVQAWSDWANWIKSQMGKPFHIYPNGVGWYSTLRANAWLSGMDGDFIEYAPTPNTWQDMISQYYQMQSLFYSVNRNAIVDFFPYDTQLPSLYWLAAYYLLAKNFTTNNLYVSPPFNYPVPQNICCGGWNPAVWDNLSLGSPQGASAIIDAFGDGTDSLYVRVFQYGVVVAMQHRQTTDTRTITVNLPGSYVNVLGGAAVSQITIGVNDAFIGIVPGSHVPAQGLSISSPLYLMLLSIAIGLQAFLRKTTKKRIIVPD